MIPTHMNIMAKNTFRKTQSKSHSPKMVVKGTAAEEPSPHRIRFMMKNMRKTVPETKNEVSRTLVFHLSPPKVLYNRAEV